MGLKSVPMILHRGQEAVNEYCKGSQMRDCKPRNRDEGPLLSGERGNQKSRDFLFLWHTQVNCPYS